MQLNRTPRENTKTRMQLETVKLILRLQREQLGKLEFSSFLFRGALAVCLFPSRKLLFKLNLNKLDNNKILSQASGVKHQVFQVSQLTVRILSFSPSLLLQQGRTLGEIDLSLPKLIL